MHVDDLTGVATSQGVPMLGGLTLGTGARERACAGQDVLAPPTAPGECAVSTGAVAPFREPGTTHAAWRPT